MKFKELFIEEKKVKVSGRLSSDKVYVIYNRDDRMDLAINLAKFIGMGIDRGNPEKFNIMNFKVIYKPSGPSFSGEWEFVYNGTKYLLTREKNGNGLYGMDYRFTQI